MRDYWLTQDLLKAAGVGFLALAALGIGLALWLPKKWWGKLLALIVVGVLISIPVRKAGQETKQQQVQVDDYKARYAKAKALFDGRCKTAGEKIYRTVEGVEGVLLLNIRQSDRPGIADNPLWPDAALPHEAAGDGYITTFLQWEQHEDKRTARGYLNSKKSDLPGYRFVDVKNAKLQYERYHLNAADPDRPRLEKEDVTSSPAKYAVTFSNEVIPEERTHWIAGTKLQVIETETKDVLAEASWYSFEPGLGSKAGFRQPWMFALTCPQWNGWDGARTRFFVDQILKPKREK